MSNAIRENEGHFKSMDLLDQCSILLQVLASFRCTREISNLEKLNGKKQVGTIYLSQKLPSNGTFVLVHQSVTGLFEKEVDLLK